MNFMCSKEEKGYFNLAEDISIAGVIEIVQSQESMKLYSYRIHDAIALYPGSPMNLSMRLPGDIHMYKECYM